MNTAVPVEIRLNYGTVFIVDGICILAYTTRRNTARNTARNTVPTQRVIYGTYTVVILPFTTVHVGVNDCIRSFTAVIMKGLGRTTILMINQ